MGDGFLQRAFEREGMKEHFFGAHLEDDKQIYIQARKVIALHEGGSEGGCVICFGRRGESYFYVRESVEIILERIRTILGS